MANPRTKWIVLGSFAAVVWVTLEVYALREGDEEKGPSGEDEKQRSRGTAYAKLEMCLIGDPPLKSGEDATTRVRRVAAQQGGAEPIADAWPKSCLPYAKSLVERARDPDLGGYIGLEFEAQRLADAIEAGKVDEIDQALDLIASSVRSLPRDAIEGVEAPDKEVATFELRDESSIPGDVGGVSTSTFEDGPVRLGFESGLVCTVDLGAAAEATPIARCAYPKDAVPEMYRFDEAIGDSGIASPTLEMVRARRDNVPVVHEVESGKIWVSGRPGAVAGAYLDERGFSALLRDGDRISLLHQPNGSADVREVPLPGSGMSAWLIGHEIISQRQSAPTALSIAPIGGDGKLGAAAEVPLDRLLEPSKAKACHTGDRTFFVMWTMSEERVYVVGRAAGKPALLPAPVAGGAVSCHDGVVSLTSIGEATVSTETCDLEACKAAHGVLPDGGHKSAATTVERDQVVLVSFDDSLGWIRVGPIGEVGRSRPKAVLVAGEYKNIYAVRLFARGRHALVLVGTDRGVVLIRVDAGGAARPVELQWVEG